MLQDFVQNTPLSPEKKNKFHRIVGNFASPDLSVIEPSLSMIEDHKQMNDNEKTLELIKNIPQKMLSLMSQHSNKNNDLISKL